MATDHDKAIEKAHSMLAVLYGPFVKAMEKIGGQEIARICGPYNSLPSHPLTRPDIACVQAALITKAM